jgi:hypothetical protein
LEYDELVKQRARATSEKKIADLDERIQDFVHVNEIKAHLQFACGPVIAQNVTFGKINSKEEPTQYGFTCVLSKKGDTTVIPVNPSNDIMPFATAKSMVSNGSLVRSYQAASRKLFASEVHRLAKEKSDAVASALGVAASVGDEADAAIEEHA